MQRDATLISAQRAVASASEARAAERDRHLADLEEYRSGKNKNDVAKDSADMTELHVKKLESSKLLRQRVPTAKELRMGGEFSECVDCDGAMDSSSGSTPFLEGGGIAHNSADQATYRAHFGPPEVTEHSASVEFTRSAQHNAPARIQSQLAQTDADREYATTSQSRVMQAEYASLVEQHGNQAKLYEAVASLMEMQGSSAASSSGSTVSLASGSASASVDDNKDASLKPLRLKDQRINRVGRTDSRSRAGRQQVDHRIGGKPRVRTDLANRDRSKDRSNKTRPNDSAAAPAQDAPVQAVEEASLTRALNLRRFAELQELPLQVAATVANEQELRLRIVAVEHSSNVESSFVTSALVLARDIRGALPSAAHATIFDPTAEDAVGRFVESEQMVVAMWRSV